MRALLLTLALTAAPAMTHAASVADVLAVKDCDKTTGVVPNETVRDKMLAAAKVPFSSKTLALFNQGLGTQLQPMWASCGPTDCSGDKKLLATAYSYATPLADENPLSTADMLVEVGPGAPATLTDRPVAFLNGDWAWLKVSCRKLPAPTPQGQEPEDPDPLFGKPAFVVAKEEDDAGKDFEDRGFATAGYSKDKVANETSFDLDIYLGWDDFFRSRNSSVRMQPFLSYQRHSSKKVDDLSLGLAAFGFPAGAGQIRLKGAWETDHRFDASVWRADLAWTTPLLNGCQRRNVPTKFYASCELTVMADHNEVADAGRKADLADVSSFTRVGGDLEFNFMRAVGDGAGFATFDAKYSSRHDLSGDADAELATVSLGFAPGDEARYKFSLDYTHGRDLTSFGKQRSLVLTIGFRN